MKNLANILNYRNSLVFQNTNKIQELIRLDTIFRLGLDETLAKHCQLGKYEQGEALVILKKPAFATRLRYNIPDIIKNVQIYPEFKDIKKIRYIIEAEDEYIIEKKIKKPLSINSQEIWQATREYLKQKIQKKQESLDVK